MTIFKMQSARAKSLEWLQLLPVTAGAEPSVDLGLDRPGYEAAKRLFDIVFVLVSSVIAIPLILLTSAIIKLTSPGPLLYRHIRIGRYGRPFTCYKLRTMFDGADALLEDEAFRARFTQAYKLDCDPRLTRVGRFLRKSSLDELPQLWNVLRGEMSLVGPRPVVEEELKEKYQQDAWTVLSVPPGLTGLWQISGRSRLTYERRVTLDLEYFAHRSFALDLWILWRTPIALLLMRGAY